MAVWRLSVAAPRCGEPVGTMELPVKVVFGRRSSPALVLVIVAVVVMAMVTVEGSPRRPAETIVGKMVSGGPARPVMHLTIPADRSTLLSTVQSVVSFGLGGAARQPPVTLRPEVVTASVPDAPRPAKGTGRPELVTASVPETALDLPQTPTTSSAAAAAAFNHSSAVHAFFGPEDAVTARSAMARRADGPQYRRVIAPVTPTPREPVTGQEKTVTMATQTATVVESVQCPPGTAFWPSNRQCVPVGKQGQ